VENRTCKMENMEIKNLFNGIFKRKKVLITGDTGFKGSWLTIWLLEMGAEVYGYALPPKTEKDNYVVCNLSKKNKHIDGDIRDRENLFDFFKKVQPDITFHLAAQPLVLDSYENPHYTFETNLMGTVNFFEAVRKTDSVKVAINITSDKCYKNNEWVWGYREIDPMGGKDPYSASKSCSELITNSYLESFFKNSHCNIASARAGNVIGAGDWAVNRIVPDFFRARIKNKKLLIRNPYATRPWQHVLEPLGGYLLLAARLYENNSFAGGWNFGPQDGMNYNVKTLIEELLNYEKNVDVEFSKNKKKPHEAGLLKLDISKAMAKLNWEPILNFEETIRLTAKGYLSDLKGKDACNNRVETIGDYLKTGKENFIKWIT